MADVRKLINAFAEEENRFPGTRFVAPCVRGGRVRAKVAGLVQTFAPIPPEFEGWGIFQAGEDGTAAVVEEADLPLVAGYLRQFPALALRLVRAVRGQTWLAYPVNESDARQRAGEARPALVHLVTEGAAFEPIAARRVGAAWFFEDVDRRADPIAAERMREALRTTMPPEDALSFKGVTPEMRTAYALALQPLQAQVERQRQSRDEARLRDALAVGGGTLGEFRDRGDYWQVEWTTSDGRRHSSAIAKRDLTVISSGICLSDRDRDFDLQSLVGVIERRGEEDW